MIRGIIEKILTEIAAINFADRVAGVITPITRKNIGEGNNPVTKIYPAYKNTPTTCEGGDYFLLVPDEKFQSLIYFEEISNTIIGQTNDAINMSHDVRLVGWFNLKKINNAVESDTLLRLILQAIPDSLTQAEEVALDVYGTQIIFEGFETKSPQIFSSYTYDEAETQYLIYPYDYGALRFTVNYYMNRCVNDISIVPNCGKK